MYIIFIILAIIVYWWWRKNFKIPNSGSLCAVTGELKSGKSTFSLALAYSKYKRNLRAVKFRNFVRKLFNRNAVGEELPCFYTTIPVGVEHVLLTKELLMRTKRFAYKSVIWVDEASLLADSQCCKDQDINDNLLMFIKLIAHETKGGSLIFNTQSVSDLHYAIKRCLNRVFYVEGTFRWLPFLLVVTLREERYSDDGSVVSVYDKDIADTLKRCIISKRVWKLFDCYAYSILTDHLPIENTKNVPITLKATKLISFNPRHELEFEVKNEEEIQ